MNTNTQPMSSMLRTLLTAAVMACAAVACVAAETTDSKDVTQADVIVIDLEHPDQPLDTRAPGSQFVPLPGEKIWNAAKERALKKDPGRSGGIFDFNIVPDDFISATNFYNERFNPGETVENLTVILSAAEARRDGKKLLLKNMRMIYFISDDPLGTAAQGDPNAPGAKPAKPKKVKPAPTTPLKPGEKKKKEPDPAASPMLMASGGRMVITAPICEIDLETNEGHASGGSSIEIFQKPEVGKEPHCTARLFSPFLRWRSWNEAATGSSEIVMYTCSNDSTEADPEVSGTFLIPQPVGPDSDVRIRGRGMIFESGKFDRLTPVYDEEGRTVGTSLVARSKAYFHTNISTEMTASTITSLMPFQGAAPEPNTTRQPGAGKTPATKNPPVDPTKVDPTKNGDKKDEKKVPTKKKPVAEPEPYKTVVTCNGPAVFDMAYVPPKTLSVVVDPKEIGTAVDLDLQPMIMGKRFDFLDTVNLVKTPVKDKPPAPGDLDMSTHMSCGHLRIRYPANSMPSMTSFPDYSEAIGGVKMFGYKEPLPPEPGMPPAPPEPFSIQCERMFLDGANDNMFLVGKDDASEENGNLPYVKSTSGAAFAQQFCFRRKTQTLTMPSDGRKKMIIHPVVDPNAAAAAAKPGAPAANANSGSMLGGGDTYISWSGPLSRELKHVPVPGKKDLLKEILTLNKDVVIEQPDSHLKIYGEFIRLHSDALTKDVEFLFAQNDVDIFMDDIEARGYQVTVDMGTDVGIDHAKAKAFFWMRLLTELPHLSDDFSLEIDGVTEPRSIWDLWRFADPCKNNTITILGNRKLGIKADVFRGGGNAVRADKFIIDKLTDNFTAYGGAVAVVKSATPPPLPSDAPKPPDAAAGANGVMSGINFSSGGDTFIQCDGPFHQNGQAHIVTAVGNVLIRQTGLALTTDRVRITMDDAQPEDPNIPDPNKPTDPKKPVAPKAPAAPKPAVDPKNPNAAVVPLPSTGATPRTPPAKTQPAVGKSDPKDPSKPVGAPGAPAPDSGDFFSGGLKVLECYGTVELATDEKVIHCDQLKFDAKKNTSFLEMIDEEDDVRIYIHEEDNTDKVMCARKYLLLNQDTGTFTPGGQLLILPFKKEAPYPRGRENSPSRRGDK
ncbi:MAG: hypothetical protein WCT04_04425 [Planctomycetota bacterium]